MPDENPAPDARPRILTRGAAPSIAYHRLAGTTPGIVYLSGFMSDMSGAKALALEDFCRARGCAYLRFDYRGHGQSEGAFEDADIETWFADACDAFDALSEGPQLLVGSSMGGWMMVLLARARPARVKALLGIAAAPDFTEELLVRELTPAHKELIDRVGKVTVPSEYDDDYVFTRGLLETGRKHLVMGAPIPFEGPVHLLHGLKDASVPYATALRLQERLTSAEVELTLVKSGDHRLSQPADLARLTRTAAALLDRLG